MPRSNDDIEGHPDDIDSSDSDSDSSDSDSDSDSESEDCDVPGVSQGAAGDCRLSMGTLEELVENYLTGETIHTVEIKGGHFGHRKECVKCGFMPQVGQLGANINPHTKSWSGRYYTAYDRLCQPCLEGWVLWNIGDDVECDDDLSEEAQKELKELRAQEAAERKAAIAEEKQRVAAVAAEEQQRKAAAAAATRKQQAAEAALQSQWPSKKSAASNNAANPLSVQKPIGKARDRH